VISGHYEDEDDDENEEEPAVPLSQTGSKRPTPGKGKHPKAVHARTNNHCDAVRKGRMASAQIGYPFSVGWQKSAAIS